MANSLTSLLPNGTSAQFEVVFEKTLSFKENVIFAPIQPAPNLQVGSETSSDEIRPVNPNSTHIERQLGETEVSYFLPSRESGVNDMYLHLGCRAPARLVERERVSTVWAIMRIRHPLLASSIRMYSYDDIRFTYDAPLSPNEAVASADKCLEYRSELKDDLISSYLNGSRTLSNERLAYLIISSLSRSSGEHEKDYDFLICATHFLGDGMALHQFANDFFALLGSSLDQGGLKEKLSAEWLKRCFSSEDMGPTLPSPIEDRLPSSTASRFSRAAARVDFNQTQQKLIGGHIFPRRSRGTRHTIVPTISLDRESTKRILKNCRNRGVSISSALFAICNIAWARTHSQGWELPMMMYSALNMRPNLLADKRLNDSYWFIAIGYFNIVLPTFFPKSGDLTSMFWHRARSAKLQSAKAAKSPMSVSRCREMANERGARARVWAKEDDDKLAGIALPKKPAPESIQMPAKPKIPSSALMGLSLLGNLDGIYKHAAFPEIKLHTLTTGSRQRSSGMLLFGYTFVEKLWVSFGYDENGFEEETVKKFWENVIDAIDEFLLL